MEGLINVLFPHESKQKMCEFLWRGNMGLRMKGFKCNSLKILKQTFLDFLDFSLKNNPE